MIKMFDNIKQEFQNVMRYLPPDIELELNGQVIKDINSIDTIRDTYIKDFIEENGKLVIFAHHKEFVEILMRELKEYTPVKIVGGMEIEDKQSSIDAFQNSVNCKVIICSLKAAGVGITLTAGSYVAFLELGWTPGEHDQAEDRLHRIGQKDNVTCFYFLVENTIEGTIYNLIQDKRKIFTEMMQDKNTICEERTNILSDLVSKLTA